MLGYWLTYLKTQLRNSCRSSKKKTLPRLGDGLSTIWTMTLQGFLGVFTTLYTIILIPTTVVILADYSYKSAFVADQEINLLACMTEIMSQVKFK